ncbi:MAG: type II toxin-antitoxin system VapC family toxin [Myxacorys californica WJT36-NPBG1]|jgi:predicted nucleic-acid-binding protein|nr:type II toxin-antitoxin system VapC family toxin [Myxacorys californica WJT36-NPBG1]
MIAVDTNIVVRLLTQDDALQYERSYQLFQSEAVFIPNTVILETEWVLRFSYKRQSHEIRTAFKNLFGLPNVHLSNARLTEQVLQWHECGLDFADAFHLAQCQLCSDFYTFDAKFVDGAKELSSCRVQYPQTQV